MHKHGLARFYGDIRLFRAKEIGGGGSLTSAGAQFPDKTTDETAMILTRAIEEYLRDIEKKPEAE